MADWEYLNSRRVARGPYASTKEDGFNGAFVVAIPGEPKAVWIISSDGMGWQHVSVSFGKNHKTPSWEVMCAVKALFWEEEDLVMQLHPPKSQWISNHPGCLHLWSPIDGQEIPVPPGIMVGIKELGTLC